MLSFEDRVPTRDEQRSVAASVGWGDHFDWDTIAASLVNSLHGVVAIDDGRVVGVGRLVGDGVRYFYVQDVMVLAEASEQGIASQMVERLLAWAREQAPAEAVVGLFASPEAIGVYRSLGFVAADQDPLGMTLDIEPA